MAPLAPLAPAAAAGEYFSLNARLTISSLVSAFVGAAAAREIVATEVKEEGGGGEELPLVEEEEQEEEVEEEMDGVVCFVGWRESRERGQQKRSW